MVWLAATWIAGSPAPELRTTGQARSLRWRYAHPELRSRLSRGVPSVLPCGLAKSKWLLGSKGYVDQHFGSFPRSTSSRANGVAGIFEEAGGAAHAKT